MPSLKFCLMRLTAPRDLYSRRLRIYDHYPAGTQVLAFNLYNWVEKEWWHFTADGKLDKETPRQMVTRACVHVLLYADFIRGTTLSRLKYPWKYASSVPLDDLEVIHPDWPNIIQGHKVRRHGNEDYLNQEFKIETRDGKTSYQVVAEPGVLPVEQQVVAANDVSVGATETLRYVVILPLDAPDRAG